MRQYFFYFIFSLLFLVNVAQAVVVPDLNVAVVPVANTSAAARQDVLPKALGEALIKLSGNPTIMTIPAIQNALDDINSFIQSYGYSQKEQPDGQSQLLLQVTFDKKALKQLLRQAAQTNWASNRPLTLLWIQITNKGNAFVLSNTNDVDLAKSVHRVAKLRGLPVLLPAMDLEDQAFISPTPGFDKILLDQASQRYGAKAILAGDIQQNGTQWQGKWLLLMNGTPYQWSNKAKSVYALMQRAINDMVNLMANQLAVADDKGLQTSVTLDITNVNSLDDYVKILSIVRHLTPVAGVAIKDMNSSDLVLQIKTIGGTQALSDALSKESQFTALESSYETNSRADLFYRWQGTQSHG